MPPRILTNEPSELLDYISSFIDRPSDLLHLALTAKTMCAVVIPTHLHFRVIRSDLDRSYLWKKLATFPAMTSKVRTLEIVHETLEVRPIIPISYIVQRMVALGKIEEEMRCLFEPAGLVEAIRLPTDILPILRIMPALTSFHWASPPCPLYVLSGLKELFPNLRDVEVNVDSTDDESNDSLLLRSSFFKLSGLRRFSFTFTFGPRNIHGGNNPQWFYSMIDMVVDRCPKLETLHIQAKNSSSVGDVYPMLLRGRWTSLKRLTLAIEVSLEVRAVMEQFFTNHPTLERLYFCDAHFEHSEPAFPLNDLPNLRSLHMDVGAHFTICSEMANRLEHFGLNFSYSLRDPFSVVPLMPTLRSLVYDAYSYPTGSTKFRSMLTGFPKLERLAINANLSRMTWDEVCAMLVVIDTLTHFSYRCHDGENISDKDAFYMALSALFPSLQYVEVSSTPFRWVKIDRSPDGGYVGYSDVTHPSKDMDVENWGQYYRGVEANEAAF